MIKVKHSVELDEQVIRTLFMQVCQTCMTTYPDTTSQDAAIEESFQQFKAKMEELAAKAFKVGKKIGKSKADVTDTKMYE